MSAVLPGIAPPRGVESALFSWSSRNETGSSMLMDHCHMIQSAEFLSCNREILTLAKVLREEMFSLDVLPFGIRRPN